MNFSFGSRSNKRLDTCHPDLERVARRAILITHIDFTIVCGLRGKIAQDTAFHDGFSKKAWPNSKHNGEAPSFAVSHALDFAPWINGTINWNDEGSFYVVGSVFMVAAKMEEVEVRGGWDWDRDGLTEDQSFMDIGHLELVLRS